MNACTENFDPSLSWAFLVLRNSGWEVDYRDGLAYASRGVERVLLTQGTLLRLAEEEAALSAEEAKRHGFEFVA